MKIRRILALIVAACLLVVNVPVAAFAEINEETAEVTDTEEEAEVADSGTAVTEATPYEIVPGTQSETVAEDVREEVEDVEDIVLTAELDDVIITLRADSDAFNNNGELLLKATAAEIDASEEKALDTVEKENVAKRVTYDITVLDDGEEIEPVKEVKVSFELKDAPSGADGVNIYHHDEKDGIEKIATEVLREAAKDENVSVSGTKAETAETAETETVKTAAEKDIEVTEVSEEDLADTDDVEIENDVTVEATTDSFSLYTVDFTYKDKTISIDGDTTGNKLEDIVGKLGIEEKVEEAITYQDAECTEEVISGEVKEDGETLFSVYEIGNEWYVDAVNAFDTEHGLVVKTEDGAEYKIRVTDNQASPVCKIVETDVSYGTVQAAIDNAVNGQKVQMIANSEENVTVIAGKNITLDLNGYVLKGKGSTRVIYIASESSTGSGDAGNLIINDSNTGGQRHYFKYSKSNAWELNDNANEDAKSNAISVDAITSLTDNDTLVKVEGGVITGGNNTSYAGGGVYINVAGKFTMTGGSICGNTANEGGGLYIAKSATVKLKNVAIIGNHAISKYGGMLFNANGGNHFTIGGKIVIWENSPASQKDNLHLWDISSSKPPLEIDTTLTEGSKIHFTIGYPENYTGPITTNGKANDVQYFFSDVANYSVVYNTDHLELVHHEHGDWNYSANGAVLTATCGKDGCTLTDNKVSITIEASGKSYDGKNYNGASIKNTDAWEAAGLDIPSIKYYVKGETAALIEEPKNAGEYTAKITAGSAAAEAEFTISPATLKVTGTTADRKVYDGKISATAHVGTLEGVVDSDKGDVAVEISVAKFSNEKVGKGKDVVVSYKLTGTKAGNYTVSDSTTSADIDKATYDMSGVSFVDKEVVYDGTAKSLTITGTLPNGVSVSYEGNGKTEAGVYAVTAKFTGDYENYERISDKTAKLTINALAKYKITYDLNGGKWAAGGENPTEYTEKSDFTLKAPERDGYVFIGWEGTESTKPEIFVIIAMGSKGDRSYKANWTQEEVKKIGGKTYKVADEIVDVNTELASDKAKELAVSNANITDFSYENINESALSQLTGEYTDANTFIFGIAVNVENIEEGKKSVSNSTKITYEVSPYIQAINNNGEVEAKEKVANSDLNGKAVNVHLAVSKDTNVALATIEHISDDKILETYTSRVYTDEAGEKYVEVFVTHFSKFVINLNEYSSSGNSAITASWFKDAKGWKYRLPGGGYATNEWCEIDNTYANDSQEKKSWFHFGEDGYMQTGWFTDKDGRKYYLNPVSDGSMGRMYHGKQTIDGKIYEFSEVHDGHYGHLIETSTNNNSKK